LSSEIEEEEINQDSQQTITAKPPDNMNKGDHQLDVRATSPTKGDVVPVLVAATQEATERQAPQGMITQCLQPCGSCFCHHLHYIEIFDLILKAHHHCHVKLRRMKSTRIADSQLLQSPQTT
jgi:hypothetical protein